MTFDPTKPHWSIMTKAMNGQVSILRDLTLDEARRTYERLSPQYGHTVRQFRHPSGTVSSSDFHLCSDGDIEIREVFGPPDWDGVLGADSWPKFETIDVDENGNPLSESAR